MNRDEIERVARAWASMDGKAESFDACKADPALEDTEGRYGGYMADAEELLQRSGLMARLEDAEAAQALVVERAAAVARRHHSKVQINEPLWHDGQDWASDRIAEAIEALADPSGVEALAALRAERDALETAREMLGGFWAKAIAERDDALTRLAAAEGRVAALTEALEDIASAQRYPSHGDPVVLRDRARAALATVTPPADTGEGRT